MKSKILVNIYQAVAVLFSIVFLISFIVIYNYKEVYQNYKNLVLNEHGDLSFYMKLIFIDILSFLCVIAFNFYAWYFSINLIINQFI
jgi:hypothetical protein